MKNGTICIIVLLIFTTHAWAAIWFDDGLVHEISSVVNDSVYVANAPDQIATTLRLLNGGSVLSLETYGHSQIEIAGGIINGRVQSHDSSILTFSSGLVYDDLLMDGGTELHMTGGEVLQNLRLGGQQTIAWISGGNLNDLSIAAGTAVVSGGFISGSIGIRTVVFLNGSEFTIDGTPVGSGSYDWFDLLDPMNPSGGNQVITMGGILANGDVINNILIGVEPSGGLILVPEPCTLLLFGMGVVILRKKL